MAKRGEIIVTFDEALAEQMYKEGATFARLAERFGVSDSTIRSRLLKRGTKLRKGPPPRQYDWDGIAADYQAGLSARRVARKHRTSTRKVMAEIRRRGIPIHKAGERKGHPSRTRKPHCKRCSILLEVVAYHEDGVCCICLAEERGVDTGTWVWATAD